jgi:integrase/recombinase XerD
MLPPITLHPFHYKGDEAIGINVHFYTPLEREVRKLKGIKWCGQNNLWYLPLSKEHYEKIKAFLADKATLQVAFLRQYLEQRKNIAPLKNGQRLSKARALIISNHPLSKENLEAYRKYHELLILKGYSDKTYKNIHQRVSSLIEVAKGDKCYKP